MLRITGLVLFGAVLFIACGPSSSLPPDDDASTGDASPTTDGGGKDTGAGKDTGVDAPPPCDGQCVPPAPTGWTFVAFDDKARNPCPTSFQTSKDTIADVTGPDATCGCSCSVASSPTCDGNSLKYFVTDDSSCSNVLTANGLSVSGCTSEYISESSSSDLYLQAYGSVTVSGGSCNTPVASKTVAPYTVGSQGRSCGIAVAVQACANKQMCVPNVAAPDQLCITADGDNNCPSGYPNLHQVGTGVDDTRDCSTCSCVASGTCDTPYVEFHSDSSCTDSAPISLVADGSCVNIYTDTIESDGLIVTASATGAACDPPKSFGATGGLDLVNMRTICCK